MAGRTQPGDRRDRDDRAAAKSHRLPDQLRRQHDPAQVQVQRVAPLRRIGRGETRLRKPPGVADQHPQPPRPPQRRADRQAHPGLGRDVRLDERPADPARGPRASLPVQIGDDHVHALARQPLRDPRPDPGRAAGHQSGQSVTIHASILHRATDIPRRQRPL
jgi:hypothetical protein